MTVTGTKGADMNDTITIRRSTDSDRAAIARLAALDDRPEPSGQALLAFVDGELRAALPLEAGRTVADPFHLTGDVVELLRFRAGHMPGLAA
jgi:hypothetical protein